MTGEDLAAPGSAGTRGGLAALLEALFREALVGLAAEEGGNAAPLAVQHVVRSFDPCMVCTVH